MVALLQEEGVDYRFNDKDGAIRVPAVKADQTRAELLSKGYPKSGFTYDMYRNNAGLMTTESDKKQYTCMTYRTGWERRYACLKAYRTPR